MSRPEKPIDWELVDKLLMAGCDGNQISPFFNIHPNTFYDRVFKEYGMSFTDYQTFKRAHGDATLLYAQYEKATGGDNTMMVWLGKNRLKQRDNPTDITISTETVQNFKSMMDQVSKAQEERKICDNNIIKEQ